MLRANIVAVIGTTGAGKSQLAIDLAQRLRGEIISVDSLQVYEGLDIATNKVTAEERKLVPHHLIDVRRPPDEYTVQDFVSDGRRLIEEIVQRDRLPILVGGTHYYLYSLLWDSVVREGDSDKASWLSSSEDDEEATHKAGPADDSLYTHARLKEIDPVMAARYHPNDHRRIRRSLEIYEKAGKPQSELFAAQSKELKYRVCVLWPTVDPSVLDERLDRRCDAMVNNGLLTELGSFHRQFPPPRDYTKGIFQAIGFKEFEEYWNAPEDSPNRDDLFGAGTSTLKRATRKYAKRQISWITSRFWKSLLRAPSQQDYHLHVLNASDLSKWTSAVVPSATTMVEQFLRGNEPAAPLDLTCPHAATLQRLKDSIGSTSAASASSSSGYHCDACDRTVYNENEWSQHLKSHQHKKRQKTSNSSK